MVPSAAYGNATVSVGADGFIDTLYPCRMDPSGLTVTTPPPGTARGGRAPATFSGAPGFSWRAEGTGTLMVG